MTFYRPFIFPSFFSVDDGSSFILQMPADPSKRRVDVFDNLGSWVHLKFSAEGTKKYITGVFGIVRNLNFGPPTIVRMTNQIACAFYGW